MKIFTIGFTKKDAPEFFGILKQAGVKRVVDVRLNNVSQLAGFTKRNDLAFFLRELLGVVYVHRPELAPTKEILDGYKKKQIGWAEYENRFMALLRERRAEQIASAQEFDRACLLCSEPEPNRCHRRLVAEYLREHWEDVEICHL